MTKWEQELSPDARAAVINANTQTGRVPIGTADAVMDELRVAGLVASVGLTARGRMAKDHLISWALGEL